MDAYWRACNYLCAGMIYLRDNPLLRKPLVPEHFKARLLGHWGSDPGQTFTWVHLNRAIVKHDLDMIYISGPGHGAPAMISNAYLEGTYSEIYPEKSADADGMLKLFRAFSFPGQLGSHCTPEVPGSIHEGGELGYSVSHAFGAAFDNPDLIVSVVVGDGEAETGPARDLVAFEQVSRSHSRWRRAAHPPSQRLQDREPDDSLAHHRRRTRSTLPRLRLGAVRRRWGRPAYDACAHGGDRRDLRAEDPRVSEGSARLREGHATALADDCAAYAEGLDGPESRRRSQGRRLVARTSSSRARREDECVSRADRRDVAEELSPRGALRLERIAPARAARAHAEGRASHERQSAHERRSRTRSAAPARLPRVRREDRGAGRHVGLPDGNDGQVFARRHEAEHALVPRVLARRERVEPPARPLRRHEEDVDGAHG